MRFVAVDDNIMAEGVTVLTVFMDDETGSSVRGWLAKITMLICTNYAWRFASRRWEQMFVRPGA
jgi:hypothetical protein